MNTHKSLKTDQQNLFYDQQAIEQQYASYKQSRKSQITMRTLSLLKQNIFSPSASLRHYCSQTQFQKSVSAKLIKKNVFNNQDHQAYPREKNDNTLNNRSQDGTQNKSEDRNQGATEAQQYLNQIIKMLGCKNFSQACQKIEKVNEANKLVVRIKEMVKICQPDQKDISLNKCWKFIKKAVYDMQKSKAVKEAKHQSLKQ